MRARGFTLLEMVVTIFIFGVIGVIAIQLLSQSVRVTDKVISRSEVLAEWHRAMSILEQDFLQHVDRSIRDEYGDRLPGFLAFNETEVEFTRSGWQNPLIQQRSELQRVGYFLQGDQLIRRYWSVLDRPFDAPYVDQVILSTVQSIEFEMIDSDGKQHSYWPIVQDESSEISMARLIAVRMTLNLYTLGEVGQIWLVPETVVVPTEIDSNEQA